MLDLEFIEPSEVDRVAAIFHRDGLVVVTDALTDEEFVSVENGATRFIRGTHRSRQPVPSLEEEPDWMKNSVACAPSKSAIVRDVRCWHGGTANMSRDMRIMTSVGYYAPWFRRPGRDGEMPRAIYDSLSDRGKTLCLSIVALG